jgi:hypothetical protein
MNEAETRADHIDPALTSAGWGVVVCANVEPRLTHDTYTHLDQIEVGANVEKLPALKISFDGLVPTPIAAPTDISAPCLHRSLHQVESETGFLSPLMTECLSGENPSENEKTLEITRKTRVFANKENSEVDGARTRNLRIDSPVL